MDWEEELFRDTPRGLSNKADAVPRAQWAPPSLGPVWKYSRSSIFLGYRDDQGVGCGDDRHVLLVAGSRAGKGVSYVIPNLLLYEGSVLAIDPKGELARETAKRRVAMGQKVIVLDPFGTTGLKSHRFNPLVEIDPRSETAIDDAALLADALVVDEGAHDKHWVNGARELVKGLILFALMQPKENRNLATVRDVLRQAPQTGKDGKQIPGYRVGLMAMAKSGDAFDGLVSAIGNSFLGKEERELSSLISTADVQLGFLDSGPLQNCLSASDFSLADLKTSPVTVYLCLPATRIATHAKWLRVILTLALLMCERIKKIPKPPLLFVLDEFPALSYMRSIESAAGQIAGFGVKLFTIIQDLTQLKKLYEGSWETFIGNAGATIYFGNADVTTLEYLSNKLGTIGFDLQRTSSASPENIRSGAKAIEEQLAVHRLLEPHEVELMFARETRRALVLYPGRRPLIVQRAIYYDDPPLKELL
jgi:type IV secretion system protein VirD4